MSVIGVDPGLGGALARYDAQAGTLDVQDMPTWHMMVGKKKRARIDANDLLDYFELQKMMGVQLVIIEAVGGRPRQSASAGFVFGYTVGLVYMACIAAKLPIETVSPQVWKKVLNVPGKREATKDAPVQYATLDDEKVAKKERKKQQDGVIIQRADELFPHYRATWRGAQGGYKLDRAEAALLAYYGGRYALGSTKVVDIRDPEWRLAYRNAKLGA